MGQHIWDCQSEWVGFYTLQYVIIRNPENVVIYHIAIEAMAQSKVSEFSHSKWWIQKTIFRFLVNVYRIG